MLNRSETMPKKAFTLSLPENVTRVFNLHDGKDGSNQCNSPQPSAQERLASICSVACDVVRHNTPRLTEAQWDSILGAVQAGACWDWALELRQVANRSSDHLATMIYDDEWLCCTNRVRDSSRESRVVAGMHEQTHTPDLQDQELASLQ